MNADNINNIIKQDFDQFKSEFQANSFEIVDRLVRNSKKIEDVINSTIKDRKTQNIFRNALTAIQYAHDQENNMNESASGFIKRNMPLVLACSFILNAFIPAFAATKQKSYHDREYEKHMERVAKEHYPNAGKKHTFAEKAMFYAFVGASHAANALAQIMPKSKADQLKDSKIVNTTDKQQAQKVSTKKQSGIPSGKRGDYIPGHYDDNGNWVAGRYSK